MTRLISFEEGAEETRVPACDCAYDRGLNRYLEGCNGRLGCYGLPGGELTVAVFVAKLDKVGPTPPVLIPSFCPFCGARYVEREATAV